MNVVSSDGSVFVFNIIEGEVGSYANDCTDNYFMMWQNDFEDRYDLELTEEQEILAHKFNIDYFAPKDTDADMAGWTEWIFDQVSFLKEDIESEICCPSDGWVEFHAKCVHGPSKGKWVSIWSDYDDDGVEWDGAGFDFLPEKDGGK